jgi:hypothetical protein
MQCLIKDCAHGGRRRRGWCDVHYKRWLRYGDPLISRQHKQSGTVTYTTWHSMMQRCYYGGHVAYARYGGRGIVVCERWHDFRNFFSDMGEKPAELTLDRIDTNGNYDPSNCRWATRTEQARNMRANRLITINGETKTMTEWASIGQIGVSTVHYRLMHGWDDEAAVTIRPGMAQ